MFSGFSQNEELDSLTIQLAYQNPDTTKVNTSIKIIKHLYNAKSYDRALRFINQSEILSNNLNFTKGSAEIFKYKGLIYAENEDYINALNNFNSSKELYTILKDTLNIAKINNNIGVLEIENGNFETGLHFSLKAINELENRGLKKDLSKAYKGLAEAYFSTGALNNALEYNLKVLEVEEELKNNEAIILANYNIGNLYAKDNKHNKAIDYLEKALIYPTTNSDSLKTIVYPKLGKQYLTQKQYKKATFYLTRAIRLNRNAENKSGIVHSLNSLAQLNYEQGDLKTAESQLTEAGSLARFLKDDHSLLKTYKLLKTIDSSNNKFEKAYAWQREYYALKQKIDLKKLKQKKQLTQSRVSTNSIIDEVIETPIVDTPIKDTNKAENQAKIDKLTLITYALLGAFLIASTFLLLIYLKRNNRIKYMRELEEKNKKIELQNDAILEQSKHLEEINKVKDRLFSIVSHDLKDSLSSTKGFIDLLKEGSLSHEEFNRMLPELSENANNASLLLFNLLNWSKSQMQSLEPNPSLFDIQEVFAEKLKLVEHKIETKGIILKDKTLRDFVYADRSMVEIIIQNLLANAVKFSKKDDVISVSNHISNGNCIISIADSGVGISKENQALLFKKDAFTTIGTKEEKGTGLGLTICKELVELNHGKIWVDSTENIGSTFYVELPKNKVNVPVNT